MVLTAAAIELIDLRPTTAAGLIALVAYAQAADTDGVGWPDGLYVDVNDPGPTKTRSWQHFLIQNLSEILPAMVDADSLARRTAA